MIINSSSDNIDNMPSSTTFFKLLSSLPYASIAFVLRMGKTVFCISILTYPMGGTSPFEDWEGKLRFAYNYIKNM